MATPFCVSLASAPQLVSMRSGDCLGTYQRTNQTKITKNSFSKGGNESMCRIRGDSGELEDSQSFEMLVYLMKISL